MDAGHRRSRPTGDSLQYAANLVTVASGVLSAVTLLSGQFIWALPAVVVVAITFYSLRTRRWWSGVLGLAVVSLAAFAVAVSLYHRAEREPAAAAPSVQGNGRQTAVSSASASAATSPPASTAPQAIISSPANSAPPTVLDNDVTLQRNAAADIDASTPTVLENQAGADGNLDLYYDSSEGIGAIIAHDSEGIFELGAGVTDAYGSCADKFDSGSSDSGHEQSVYASLGTEFCFRTSGGLMAYAVVAAVNPPGGQAIPRTVTLHVTVWDQRVS
jgi:hypothetical protein